MRVYFREKRRSGETHSYMQESMECDAVRCNRSISSLGSRTKRNVLNEGCLEHMLGLWRLHIEFSEYPFGHTGY